MHRKAYVGRNAQKRGYTFSCRFLLTKNAETEYASLENFKFWVLDFH